ncbi:unnamed protein product [Effrenium voratum]|uniref:phosphoglycerate mutase (2,3-diphosphoglycerate-dependent) n=1 Tax=Effrenium voratum TaxID=2562239 RepID=A0AA36HXE2_9DINO|nr:unnamed protein product [Effrenium voratum]
MPSLGLSEEPIPLWWTTDFILASPEGTPADQEKWIVGEFNCSCVGISKCLAAYCKDDTPQASFKDIAADDLKEAQTYGDMMGSKALGILDAAACQPVDVSSLTRVAKDFAGLRPQPSSVCYKTALAQIYVRSAPYGGSDKSSNGHRYDSIPFANGMINAGMSCQLIHYTHEGELRYNMVVDTLVGIIHKKPKEGGISAVGGTGSIYTYYGPEETKFKALTENFLKRDLPHVMPSLGLAEEPIPLWWTTDFILASPAGTPADQEKWIVGEFNCSCVGISKCLAAYCKDDTPNATYYDIEASDLKDADAYGDLMGVKAKAILEQAQNPGELRYNMVVDTLVGIIHKKPKEGGISAVGGTGSIYTYYGPEETKFKALTENFLKRDLPHVMPSLGLAEEPIPLWWTTDFILASPEGTPADQEKWIVGEFNCSCVGISKCLAAYCKDDTPKASYNDIEPEDLKAAQAYGDLMGVKALGILQKSGTADGPGELRYNMVVDTLVGIIHKKPKEGGISAVGGTGSIYTYYGPEETKFKALTENFLKRDLPHVMPSLGLAEEPIPLWWTTDFILASPEGTPADQEKWIVGEFNCSCVGISKCLAAYCKDDTPKASYNDIEPEDLKAAQAYGDLMGVKALGILQKSGTADGPGELRYNMVVDTLVGIIHKKPKEGGISAVGGTGSIYTYYGPEETKFKALTENFLKRDLPHVMPSLGLAEEPIPLWWTTDFILASPEGTPADQEKWIVGEFNCSCVGISKCLAAYCKDDTPKASYNDIEPEDLKAAQAYGDLMGVKALGILSAGGAAGASAGGASCGRLVLLRHGAVQMPHAGWADVELSEQGKAEAASAGQLLKSAKLRCDIAFASVLRRSVRTAWTALMECDHYSLPVVNTWRLNERHFGDMQGKEGAVPDSAPTPVPTSDSRHPANDALYRHVAKATLPSGESVQHVVDRVLSFYSDSVAPCVMAGKTVLVSGHGASLHAICQLLEGDAKVADVAPGVPLVYEVDANLKVLRKYYLDDALAQKKLSEVK